MDIAPKLLSGSTDGKPIQVTGTTTGTSVTIHTAVAGSVTYDEIYLWAVNTSASSVTLTIEFGGSGDGSLLVKTVTIPANSVLWPICPGLRANNGVVIKAFASVANVLNILGNVNRWT